MLITLFHLSLGQLLLSHHARGRCGDVDGVVEVGVQVDGRAADEVAPAVLHQQGGQALVGRCQSALQRQQAGGAKLASRTVRGSVPPSTQATTSCMSIAKRASRWRRRTARPERRSNTNATGLLDAVQGCPFAQVGADRGQRNQLRGIGQAALVEDLLLGQQLGRALESPVPGPPAPLKSARSNFSTSARLQLTAVFEPGAAGSWPAG